MANRYDPNGFATDEGASGSGANRDIRRMADRLATQDFRAPGGWGNDTGRQYQQRAQPSDSRQQHNKKRANNWREKRASRPPPASARTSDAPQTSGMPPTRRRETNKYMSKTSTPTQDDPLYTCTAGSIRVKKIRSQNLDFSSFPQLCEVVYHQLREKVSRIQREMPYPVFLHAMNNVLQAWLLDTVVNVNQESRFEDELEPLSLLPKEMIVPVVLAQYLMQINTNITPDGDTVYVNIPTAIVPMEGRDAVEAAPPVAAIPEIPAGSFGICNALTHNAYEVNISPLITMRSVQSIAEAEDLAPLPVGLFPANGVATRNLLGWTARTATYTEEVKAMIRGYDFPDNDNLAGRLRICPALLEDVQAVLHRCEEFMDMVKVSDLTRSTGLACSVFNEYDHVYVGAGASRAQLVEQTPTIYALFNFGSVTASQATLFGLKKKRTTDARGFCYVTAAGAAPNGWTDTMNNNFEMTGSYTPEWGADYPALRSKESRAILEDGLTRQKVADWTSKFIKRQRRN